MKAWKAPILMLAALAVLLVAVGCEEGRDFGDCKIRGVVVDAGTEAPIDSAEVYVAYFNFSLPTSVIERHFKCLSDDNGRFAILVGCNDIQLVDVEKEGYLRSAPVRLRGGGDVNFALYRIER